MSIPQPTQYQPEVIIAPKSNSPLSRLLLPLALLILGIVLGFTANYLLQANLQNQPQPKKQIPEADIPIGLPYLINPVINQWSGAVEGKLIAKDNDTFTIQNDKGQIIIPLRVPPSTDIMTKFYDFETHKAKGTSEVSLNDIPLGAQLRGNFFVTNVDKNRIVGGSFTVVKR